jgi:hypothetical protein
MHCVGQYFSGIYGSEYCSGCTIHTLVMAEIHCRDEKSGLGKKNTSANDPLFQEPIVSAASSCFGSHKWIASYDCMK